MKPAICTREGCTAPVDSKNLCRRHYDQGRDYRTRERVIYQWARHRAVAALIELHHTAFDQLVKEQVALARVELEALDKHAARQTTVASTPQSGHLVKLRPGPKAGQTLIERIDVGTCPSCARHHDSGHECPSCHTDLTEWLAAPDNSARVRIMRRMLCTQCGKDARRKADPCIDDGGHRHVLHDYELQRATG